MRAGECVDAIKLHKAQAFYALSKISPFSRPGGAEAELVFVQKQVAGLGVWQKRDGHQLCNIVARDLSLSRLRTRSKLCSHIIWSSLQPIKAG